LDVFGRIFHHHYFKFWPILDWTWTSKEHTALRIREFGTLQGYKKAKARYYKLVVILDDRTSDICRALAAQDKIYPLNDALDVMDNLMALDTKSNSLDDAREYIKALAPWIKDDQIEYDSEMNP